MGGASLSSIAILVAFVVLTAPATASDCLSIFSCSSFLQDPNLTPPPGSSCCNSAAHLLADFDDVESLCQCLSPFTSRFLLSKAQQIPSLCNLPSFSDIVPCFAPPSAVVPDSFLPPLGPFPPIFPLPPVFSFPPLPFFPLPPFRPFTPPAPAPPPAEV